MTSFNYFQLFSIILNYSQFFITNLILNDYEKILDPRGNSPD